MLSPLEHLESNATEPRRTRHGNDWHGSVLSARTRVAWKREIETRTQAATTAQSCRFYRQRLTETWKRITESTSRLALHMLQRKSVEPLVRFGLPLPSKVRSTSEPAPNYRKCRPIAMPQAVLVTTSPRPSWKHLGSTKPKVLSRCFYVPPFLPV